MELWVKISKHEAQLCQRSFKLLWCDCALWGIQAGGGATVLVVVAFLDYCLRTGGASLPEWVHSVVPRASLLRAGSAQRGPASPLHFLRGQWAPCCSRLCHRFSLSLCFFIQVIDCTISCAIDRGLLKVVCDGALSLSSWLFPWYILGTFLLCESTT